jgi:endo-1,4-beta-mannosidase
VSEAKKYKIRLILSLTNNWDAYGGKAQYVKWGKATGLNLTSDDDFFSHPTLRSYYKAHVKATFILLSQKNFFLCTLTSNSENNPLTVGLTVSLFIECRRY